MASGGADDPLSRKVTSTVTWAGFGVAYEYDFTLFPGPVESADKQWR